MTNLPRIQGMVAYGTPAETAQYYDLNFASVGVSTETGTDYTFRPTDSGGWVRFTSSSAVTATIAAFSSIELPFGAVIMVEQAGTGLVTIAAGVGVTVYGVSSVPGQYSVLRLVNLARNVWSVTDGGGAGSSTSVTLYASRSAAALADIEPTIDAIQTAGFAAAGDGGAAIYYRAGGSTIGGFQSFDGAWWGLAGNVTNVRWTLIGDTDETISPSLGDLDTMNRFATNAALTAARTWTLPAASAVPAGWPIAVFDLAGAITNVNTLTIARAGSDTIAGQASLLLSSAYDGVELVSDGVSAWAIENGWRNRASRTRFWSNINNGAAITTPRILSHRQRIFVGAAVEYSGVATSSNPTFGWLTQATGPNWLGRDGAVVSVNEDAGIAVFGASRSNDSSSAAGPGIGVAGYALADRAAAGGWGGYFETIRNNATALGQGIEIDVRNCAAGSAPDDPYGTERGPHALWIACGPGGDTGASGYGPAPTADSGTAIFVVCNTTGANTYKFTGGIGFACDALSGVTGANGEVTGGVPAVQMGRGQDLVWYASDGNPKVRIGSRMNSTDTNMSVAFTGGGITFARNNAVENILQLDVNASAVNYFRIVNAASTTSPSLSSQGTDTNIDLVLTPKGNGVVRSVASIKAHSGTAIPAGGTAGAGVLVSSTTNFGVFPGSGAPTLAAAKGSLYLRSDGSGPNDRMYVNTDGSTTWTAVVTVA